MNAPIRVLHVVPALSRVGGVERFVYNMALYHDENRVHYDFLHYGVINDKSMYPQTMMHSCRKWGRKYTQSTTQGLIFSVL